MYYFIVNPGSRSGHGKNIWHAVENILKKEQIEYQAFFTSHRYHATELARELTSRNEKLTLIALGGDGTVNEVVSGIQDFSLVTFAYIPTGSSNDFARSLGLPSTPEEAIQNILRPTYFQKLDLGTITTAGKTWRFADSVGVGFDAAVCHEALSSKIKDLLNKCKLGKLTYVGIALKQIIMSKKFSSVMILDDTQKLTYPKTFMATVLNGCYEGGGLKLCPSAVANDGWLDICVVENLPRFVVAMMLPTAYAGKHTIFPGIHLYRAKKVEIQIQSNLPVHTDGEPTFSSEKIEISCIPECLTMITGKAPV